MGIIITSDLAPQSPGSSGNLSGPLIISGRFIFGVLSISFEISVCALQTYGIKDNGLVQRVLSYICANVNYPSSSICVTTWNGNLDLG